VVDCITEGDHGTRLDTAGSEDSCVNTGFKPFKHVVSDHISIEDSWVLVEELFDLIQALPVNLDFIDVLDDYRVL
jgi:hypothetical protein